VTASASPPTPRRPLQRWRAREAQFAVTADGIRSDDPSSKLLAPPRPVEAALAPLQLQRWPDAAAAPCADGRLRPYRAAVAHGTKRVHKQASSSCSAVENLQPQQLARSVFFLDCLSRSSRRTRIWHRTTNSVYDVASLSGPKCSDSHSILPNISRLRRADLPPHPTPQTSVYTPACSP
jgi:hypothetical protein